ncbi:MAG: glycine cleavage system aminomethyltransferase GcvT [Kiritimatiellia bacterium]|nr:glycine cleavage system aminomethyltransferase GcvT [Kiritimatiellia bacterium]
MPEIARTPLYAEHVKLGARLVPFAGWEMPLLYRGIIPEHLYTREKVSVFDICHMGEFEISGPSAEGDLEKLLTQSVASIPEGGCAYGYLPAEDGGVLDDLICYRFDPSIKLRAGKLTAGRFGGKKFWLVVNAATAASDAQWIKSHLSAKTVFRDLSSATAKLDIQGPRAREEMESSLSVKLPELEYYHFCPIELDGVSCLLSRTGYTGEFGYELYLPAAQAGRFWELLLKESAILPAGLGARDTLRVEMGFPLYGHELSRERTPAGAARGKKFIDLNKSFIGKEAVLRDIENPSASLLAGLRLEGRMAARPDDVILEGEKGGKTVGKVTSGFFAPSLNVAVALGYVERQFASIGQKLNIKSRGKNLSAEVVKLPFYKQGTARGKA